MTVLAAVVAVFVLFVGLQGAYLFGGLDTLEATGITLRRVRATRLLRARGGGLPGGRAGRSGSSAWPAIGPACSSGWQSALVVLTGVVIASSALRLRLYQEAYGWTELRFYVLATIVLMAVGAIALLAALVTDRVRWIGHVLIVAALAIGLAVNLIGPVRFIIEQNVARVLESRASCRRRKQRARRALRDLARRRCRAGAGSGAAGHRRR